MFILPADKLHYYSRVSQKALLTVWACDTMILWLGDSEHCVTHTVLWFWLFYYYYCLFTQPLLSSRTCITRWTRVYSEKKQLNHTHYQSWIYIPRPGATFNFLLRTSYIESQWKVGMFLYRHDLSSNTRWHTGKQCDSYCTDASAFASVTHPCVIRV